MLALQSKEGNLPVPFSFSFFCTNSRGGSTSAAFHLVWPSSRVRVSALGVQLGSGAWCAGEYLVCVTW